MKTCIVGRPRAAEDLALELGLKPGEWRLVTELPQLLGYRKEDVKLYLANGATRFVPQINQFMRERGITPEPKPSRKYRHP